MLNARANRAFLARAVTWCLERGIDPFLDLGAVLDPYLARLAAGSAVVVSHVSDDQDDPEVVARLHAAAAAFHDTTTAVTLRSRAELHAALPSLTLVEPGLVELLDRPAPGSHRWTTGFYGAVVAIPG